MPSELTAPLRSWRRASPDVPAALRPCIPPSRAVGVGMHGAGCHCGGRGPADR